MEQIAQIGIAIMAIITRSALVPSWSKFFKVSEFVYSRATSRMLAAIKTK